MSRKYDDTYSKLSMRHLDLNPLVPLLLPFSKLRLPCRISLAWFDGQLHLYEALGIKPLWFNEWLCLWCHAKTQLSSRHAVRGKMLSPKTLHTSLRVLKWWKSDKLIMTFATAKCFALCKHTACHISYHPMNGAQESTSDLPFQAFRGVISHISWVLTGAVLELMVHCLTLCFTRTLTCSEVWQSVIVWSCPIYNAY